MATRPNRIVTRVITKLIIQKNSQEEKRGNMKPVHRISNNQGDEENGKSEEAPKISDLDNKSQSHDSPKDSPVRVDKAEERSTPERHSDASAVCEPIEEAETRHVSHGTSETNDKTPQLKRLSESYTAGVPTKRISEEKPEELNKEINYAIKPILDEPIEPIDIASHSSDSFEVRRDIKVEAEILTSNYSQRNTRNRKNKN